MKQKFKLIDNDEWLLPVADAVAERYERYLSGSKQIKDSYGSISKFADGYKYYGINFDKEKDGWYYREWAPNAIQLYFFGDFNQWNRFSHPMKRNEKGDWEIFLDRTTFENTFIHKSKVKVLVHSDRGRHERIPVYITRVVQDEKTPNFSGQIWMPKKKKRVRKGRKKFDVRTIKTPLIYECHVGMAQEKDGVGTYTEFADIVLPRIEKAGYNIIQLMAIAEHPYYGSFGYHVSNFFAASSRFGTPEDLVYLIDTAHNMGIGVIMDLVHSHTVKNLNEGINEFDGSASLYFHSGDRGHHPDWDSKLFDYGKLEVKRFLLSNIKYWMKEFEFDGFRFDGVTSMMYFHHGQGVVFDRPEKYFQDGAEFDAILYLQLANTLIHSINKNAISIAEDVSGMPGLCAPVKNGGIGFDYRLGMGLPDFWIKILKEQKDEDWYVKGFYDAMLDRKHDVPTIAYCESHDQALVGDKTIAFRLIDSDMYHNMGKNKDSLIVDRGLALHKIIRLFTLSLGGNAYMNFMGNEFGHPEWIDFPREGNNYSHFYARRQWSLMDNKELKYHYLSDFDVVMLKFATEINIFSAFPPTELLHDEWHKTMVFERNNRIFVFNFHPTISMTDYEIPVPVAGKYRIAINTDATEFGGFGRVADSVEYFTEPAGEGQVLRAYIPNRTAMIFEKESDEKNKN